MAFAALAERSKAVKRVMLFVLNDEEEAGYFYHDLHQALGDERALFFPSTYRRAVKYAQRDAANEILRTEVLNQLSSYYQRRKTGKNLPLFVVSHAAALAEKVTPPQTMAERTMHLKEGDVYDLTELSRQLMELGFKRRDYVYEPGEFAVRGSKLDINSFAAEYPFRIDFFGDDIDSIRTFEVQTQLSRERRTEVSIVPDAEQGAQGMVPMTDYLPADTVLVVKDLALIHDDIDRIYAEGFAQQAMMAKEPTSQKEEAKMRDRFNKENLLITGEALLRGVAGLQRVNIGTQPLGTPAAIVQFNSTQQPLFHKNFELLRRNLGELKAAGYTIYILADSAKQNERLQNIFEEMGAQRDFFIPVSKTLHAGFTDNDLKVCCFTDHQIFDRFHKYNLKSDHARDAKMALTLKEIMQFEPGDFIVHMDHGVGRFAGLVRMPTADGEMQEMIKLTYKNDDAVYVSIHSLQKVSKYKGKEGEPPRISTLGTGAWEKLKERTKTRIKDIARGLIKLYSQRIEEKGFAFSELEAGLAYEESPDHLRVTQEVKADRESA